MNVLVTGGFGAIGSWVSRSLVEDGHDVTVLSRTRDDRLVADVAGELRHVAGSILDVDIVRRAIDDHSVTRIIHCAAALGVAGERDLVGTYQTNLIGSLNVFRAAHESDVERVAYTSTKGVYGRLPDRYRAPTFEPITEDLAGQPYSVYGASKKSLEGAAAQCRRVWGLDIVALRLGSTFGPGKGGQHAGYSGLKAAIVHSAIDGTPLVVDDPDVLDDMVYNADVGRAHVLACFAESLQDWIFNISGGGLVSLRAWTEEVMRVCPGHEITFGDASGAALGSSVRGCIDIERARAQLGYEPRFPGVSGVADYVQRERDARARKQVV